MSRVFEKPEHLSDFLFRITDNGGESADRYTVIFSDGSYLGMSGAPTHPQGVSMWGEGIDPATAQEWVENGEAVDLALGDMPGHLVEHVLSRCNEGLADFLEAVEKGEAHAVAPDRDAAEENDGTHTCTGKGLYRGTDGYMVRLEGNPEDDRGPFNDAAEAVRMTLPDQHSLSGPEYHSSLDVVRLEPDPEVAAAVAALEDRREAEWNARTRAGV